jgi:CheY-like chemotaxis protein
LVLEDEPYLEPWIQSLRERGHQVTHVETAADALAELLGPQRQYDLLVLDLAVPCGDLTGVKAPSDLGGTEIGWLVMNEVRYSEDSPSRDAWVLVFSAWASVESKHYPRLAADPKCRIVAKAEEHSRLEGALAVCLGEAPEGAEEEEGD